MCSYQADELRIKTRRMRYCAFFLEGRMPVFITCASRMSLAFENTQGKYFLSCCDAV